MKRRTLLLSATAFASLGGRAIAQTAGPIRVIGPPNDGFKAVHYARRAGIFRTYGLNVEITIINSGAAAAAALIGGSADVAYTNITTTITAHNKSLPIQILAPGALFNSDARMTTAILALTDGTVRTGRDLNGKTVGAVSLGDSMSAGFQAWIDQTGGDSKTVKIVEVPASAAVQMLEEGRVSAVAVNEPAVTQAVATGKARALANPNDAIAKTFLSALFAVMGPASDKTPDAMRRFAQAVHEASAYTNTHLAETVDLVAGYSGIAPEVVARSARFTDAEYVESALIQPVIDVLVRYGITDRVFPAQDVISPYVLKRR